MNKRKAVMVQQALPPSQPYDWDGNGPEIPLTAAAPPNEPSASKPPVLKRFGGVDGIMTTVGHIHKVCCMFQQLHSVMQTFGSWGGPQAVVSQIGNKRLQRKSRKPKSARVHSLSSSKSKRN